MPQEIDRLGEEQEVTSKRGEGMLVIGEGAWATNMLSDRYGRHE